MSEEVNKRLDTIIRLVSVLATQGKKQSEKIQILSAVGFQPKDIAQLIGTTSNTVRVALSNARKKG